MTPQHTGVQARAAVEQRSQRRRRQRHPKLTAAEEMPPALSAQQPMMLQLPPGLESPRALQAAGEPAFIRTLPGLGAGAAPRTPPPRRGQLAGLLTDGVLVGSGNVHSPEAGLCSALGTAKRAPTSAAGPPGAAAQHGAAEQRGAAGAPDDSPNDGISTTASGASSPRSDSRKASHATSALELGSRERAGSKASTAWEPESRRGSHAPSTSGSEGEVRRGSHASSLLAAESEGSHASPLAPVKLDFTPYKTESSPLEASITPQKLGLTPQSTDCEPKKVLAYPSPCPPAAASPGASGWKPAPRTPGKEVLRIKHAWQSRAGCSAAQLSVRAGEFVRVWADSRTAHGWLYAERLGDSGVAGWLPAWAAEVMPPGMQWMCAARSWVAAKASQMHLQIGSVLLVSTSQRTPDGMVFAELPEDAASCLPLPRTLRGPQAGWVPISCLEWPAC